MVGITVLPERSTRAAPGGACTSARRPTVVNRLFSTTNAEFSIVLPSPVMSRAPSYTVTFAGAWLCACATPAARISDARTNLHDDIHFARFIEPSSDTIRLD